MMVASECMSKSVLPYKMLEPKLPKLLYPFQTLFASV